MRTTVVLDDELVKEALELTGIKTKRGLLKEALLTLIAQRKRRSLLDLKDRIHFREGYDYKELRE